MKRVIPDEAVDYAVMRVIECGLKPIQAAREAVCRFRLDFSEITIRDRIVIRTGANTTIPMQVLEAVAEVVKANPEKSLTACVRKYITDTNSPFAVGSVLNKFRVEILGKPTKKRQVRQGFDGSEYTNFWTLDEWKRRGLIKAKE